MSNINTAPSSTSGDSLDAAGKVSPSKYSTSPLSNSNKRILKIGFAGFTSLSLITGLSVGLTNKKNSSKNVTASAAVGAYAAVDISDEECSSRSTKSSKANGSKSPKSSSSSSRSDMSARLLEGFNLEASDGMGKHLKHGSHLTRSKSYPGSVF